MQSQFWSIFAAATALKAMLIPAYHSTDFEVHRNWLAITHSLPLGQWYKDETSEWTLDYPPFFAYFEWLLAKLASFVDPEMLNVQNLNYASELTVYFQRASVIVVDIVYALGILRCLRALGICKQTQHHLAGETLLLLNVGLLFVDHIHFQYNGFLFGILLFSISFLLEDRFLLSAFTFAVLLNFKHIFLYMAPPLAVYLLRFYCFDKSYSNAVKRILKLLVVGLLPFALSFGPFWQQLPQVLRRLFPFKRGLTHAYWAPNFWAFYNVLDKFAAMVLRIPSNAGSSTSSGLVQEFKHVVLPIISPAVTFMLTFVFMLPILLKLFYTTKSESKLVFLRAVVLCSCASFMFGWHVHEKAILMCLIPLCLLCLLHEADAKYAFLLSVVGYVSLMPLLFHMDLIIIRYSLFLSYMGFMYGQLARMYKSAVDFNILENIYLYGFVLLPLYEYVISPLLGLQKRLPFMPLLLTSLYCSLGVLYFFIRYYFYALGIKLSTKTKHKGKAKTKTKGKSEKHSDISHFLNGRKKTQ